MANIAIATLAIFAIVSIYKTQNQAYNIIIFHTPPEYNYTIILLCNFNLNNTKTIRYSKHGKRSNCYNL